RWLEVRGFGELNRPVVRVLVRRSLRQVETTDAAVVGPAIAISQAARDRVNLVNRQRGVESKRAGMRDSRDAGVYGTIDVDGANGITFTVSLVILNADCRGDSAGKNGTTHLRINVSGLRGRLPIRQRRSSIQGFIVKLESNVARPDARAGSCHDFD